MKILRGTALSFAVVLGVAACSTNETAPVPEGDRPEGVANASSIDETATSSDEQATEGGPPMAESGPADLYIARNTVRGKPYPQAEWTGSFAVRDGCLVLEIVGRDESYLPILPANARVVGDDITGATADGRTLSLGVEYRIVGGTIPIEGNPDVKLAQARPAGCGFTPFLVGDIG